MADLHSSVIVTKTDGRLWVTFKGPETVNSPGFAPPGSEWIGLVLRPGVHFGSLLPSRLRDRQDLTVPASRHRRFGFEGASLEVPNFSNAEDLVQRLVRLGFGEFDPMAEDVVARRPVAMSERTIQRRFRHATGVLPIEALQIQRARGAVVLLKNGVPLAEAALQAGYFDQAHMTRSLGRFIGVTPSAVADPGRQVSLSFLPEKERP